MPLERDNEHEAIINSYFRYARLDYVYWADDTVDLTLLDANDQPTDYRYFSVPLYYHCRPDSQRRSNGAIEGAYQAFAPGDEVIVRFRKDEPVVMAHRYGLVPCGLKAYIRDHGYIYEGIVVGLPETGTMKIKDLSYLGLTGDDFIRYLDRFLLVQAGKVKIGRWETLPYIDATVTGQFGIVYGVTAYHEGGYHYILTEERNEQESSVAWSAKIVRYKSQNLENWSYDGIANEYNACVTPRLENLSHNVLAGAGYWTDGDKYALRVDPRRLQGYPNPVLRLFRCGMRTRFNAQKTEFAPYEFYTAYWTGSTFTFEANFEVEGRTASEDVQILHIH